MQVANSGYANGFVAVTVNPDGKSVVINWQVTGTSVPVQMTAAGIFGPATKDQVVYQSIVKILRAMLIQRSEQH